jgi:hypothetical protein
MIAAIVFLSIIAVLVLSVLWASGTNNQPSRYQHDSGATMTGDDATVLKVLKLAGARPRHERFGQRIFNSAYQVDPERTDMLRSTRVDPFYDDSQVDEFLRAFASIEDWSTEGWSWE